jgi:CheY-like chemotaxis protein
MLHPTETRVEENRSLVRELAHELRDALSPLASSADLARLRNFDPETSRLLAEKVERGLRRALAILDTFVLAEQCESGALPLTVNRVPLEQIVQTAQCALGEQGQARFRFTPAGAGAMVHADAARSAQVLTAVLQHAAAIATPDNLVEVRVAENAQPHILVRVRIEPGKSPRDEWFATYRSLEGHMALRTARRMMTLQGGALDLLTSGHDEWVLRMRFAAASGEADTPPRESWQPQPGERSRPAEPSSAAVGRRILIVDDSLEVRRTYREALAALGYTVVEAADAEQALSALEGTRPQVALIDIHLPRMNGFRLAQAIRARAGAAIYLVMLSGMTLDSTTRGLAREAGFDDCLDKMAGPIALRKLLVAAADRGC